MADRAATALIEALGFDPHAIIGLKVETYEGDPLVITVQHIPSYQGESNDEWDAKLADAVRQYRLVPIEKEQPDVQQPSG